MKQAKGFTLIELVIVIVILGILSIAILPVYADFSDDAETAAAQSILGNYRVAATLAQVETATKSTPLVITADGLNTKMSKVPGECDNFGVDTTFDCTIGSTNYVYLITPQTADDKAVVIVQGQAW